MKSAIIKTLCYSAVFDFPLTAVEIHARLIGQTATLRKVENGLKRSALASRHGLYFLGSSAVVSKRLRLVAANRHKLAFARRIGRLLKIIPSIQAVYVTGAVAVGNAGVDDDIDIMIITTPNSLWTTRLVVNSTLDLFGRRRRPQTLKLNDKVCLNLWLTTKNLAMPIAKRNLYTAYEIVQAKLLWDRHDTHRQFLWANRWLKNFLPNTTILKPSVARQSLGDGGAKISLIERFAFFLQQAKMKSAITREKIGQNYAFFHPRDTKNLVEQKYRQLCQKYL